MKGIIMEYIYLNASFYNKYPQNIYPEIVQKRSRPYVQIVISINSQKWAIPLRSNIMHKHVLWSNKAAKCGIDLSKAVPIDDIDIERKATIRQIEFNQLKGKEYILKKKFEKYIAKYKAAKNNLSKQHNQTLVSCSTLQYFEEYL
ncbi:MAG: hypothetical protein E7J67_08160 [Veillonella sp.]|nr:hypothetical protein [Veillonella sp.]MDU7796323.1 hypothetical protein [Veillonella parvula]MDU7824459.1 hypothetical protein [Veillonella sp.]MDU7871967.1 hypothetical protein [Veillonella sp.]